MRKKKERKTCSLKDRGSSCNACESYQQPLWHQPYRDCMGTHTLVVNNSTLTGLKIPSKRNAMSDIENLANYSVLVKSLLLKENLKPLLY